MYSFSNSPNTFFMLKFLVGWVGSAKSGLLAINPVSLLDYVRIAQSLNPTLNIPCHSVMIRNLQVISLTLLSLTTDH